MAAIDASAAQPVIPLLTPLDGFTYLVAIAGGTILWAARKAHNLENDNGQWMNDVLGIGSIEILLLLVTSSFTNRMPFFPQFIIPPENELIKDNGILIPIVFTYGAVMVAANLTGSLRKKWGGYFVVGRDFILVKIKGLMSG